MSQLSGPTPIYDALLALATPSEHDDIVDAGDPAWLSPNLKYGGTLSNGTDKRDAPRKAYAAINAILERVLRDPDLKVTGVDTRQIPPMRMEIDSELLRSGHLRWLQGDPPESQLQFDWGGDDLIKIITLRVEPAERHVATIPQTEGPPDLIGRERKNDTRRLVRMQELVSSGMPPYAAARRVAIEMPDPDKTPDRSVAERLKKKFDARLKKT